MMMLWLHEIARGNIISFFFQRKRNAKSKRRKNR
jgi:hypothetical protein